MTDDTKRSVICDNCFEQMIKHSSYPSQYALQLEAIDVNINDTGFIYGSIVTPCISKTLHFCDLKCLKEWARSHD